MCLSVQVCPSVSASVRRLRLPLYLCSLSWHASVELRDLAVDEGTQGFFQFIVVPLQLSVVFLLVRTDQGFVLPQGIFAPGGKDNELVFYQ